MLCSVHACENMARARGLCSAHLMRLNAHGDVLAHIPLRRYGVAMQFLIKVALPFADKENCLFWPFLRSDQGRAKITVKGRLEQAARVLCEMAHGAPPSPQYEAAHSCGKGHLACVNPHHLSWKTHAENMGDMVAHGTVAWGERSGTSKLTIAEVREIKRMAGADTHENIARKFGVSRSAVTNILRGITWARAR